MICAQVLLEPLPVLANLAPTRLYVAAKTFTTSNLWDVLFLVPRALVADFGAIGEIASLEIEIPDPGQSVFDTIVSTQFFAIHHHSMLILL